MRNLIAKTLGSSLLAGVFIATNLLFISLPAQAQGIITDPGDDPGIIIEEDCVETGTGQIDCPGGTEPVDPDKDSYKSDSNGKCSGKDIKLGVPLENGNDCLKSGKGDNNPIYRYMGVIIRFLSAGVGVVVMLMIVISGIQYITSAGNPDAVQAAKKRLTNAVLALVLFIFMAWILNVLIPGGWL